MPSNDVVCVSSGDRGGQAQLLLKHLIKVIMPSRQNLALHASSAVTQSKWDPLSTSSDGPGGNMQQMLSEANLESMKSIRPVKPSPGMWSGQTSPRLLQLRGAHLLSTPGLG